jgi:CspA family cold shock protein
MPVGTVKWFNETKGFGFIRPDDKGEDVFVHVSELEKSGIKNLQEGQKVSYELVSNRGRVAAGQIKLV